MLAVDKNRSDATNQTDYTKYIRFAKVIKVYDSSYLGKNYGSVDLVWMDTLDQINGPVSFVKPFYSISQGCGIITMPCVNDIAACYTVQDAPPIILGFLSKNQIDAAVYADPAGFSSIGYIRPLKSGEILIKGKSKSEIYIKNNGSISICTKNGNNTTVSVDSDPTYNKDIISGKSDGSIKNTVTELVVGLDDTFLNNRKSGHSDSVFNIASYEYAKNSLVLTGFKNKTTYDMPISIDCEIASIDSVSIMYPSNGEYKQKKSVTSGITLRQNYTYLPKSVGAYGSSENPCSLDINNSFASFEIPAIYSGLITEDTKLAVQYTTRKRKWGIQANDLGDVFIDGRNIVLRSSESKAYLGLFDDGSVHLGGSAVSIGDKLHGSIQTTCGGVSISSGINDAADIVNIKADTANEYLGNKVYFYISDAYPLIVYDSLNRQYSICSLDDYLNLSNYDKTRIFPRNFDPEGGSSENFTQSKLEELIQNYSGSIISYGEMKVL